MIGSVEPGGLQFNNKLPEPIRILLAELNQRIVELSERVRILESGKPKRNRQDSPQIVPVNDSIEL